MRRRSFLRVSGSAAIALSVGGCAFGVRGRAGATPPANLAPVQVSWDRIIRTTVGLRPYRDSGFLLRADRLDAKTVIHNFGHGGAGMSLSWGTAHLAADLALAHDDRRVAVLGCGIVGLTAARILQRRGFEVTIYAASLPPDTTSNMSWGGFTPASGLALADRRTPEWDGQFRRAVEIAYREHQLLVGRGYGVSWIDSYTPMDAPSTGRGGGFGTGGGMTELLSSAVEVGGVLLDRDEHPFSTRYALRTINLRFEPSVYLEALMRDVLAFGGRIVVRSFSSPRDVAALDESLVVNCTGLGAKSLFGDEELIPVKGQLVVLVPQPEVRYSQGGMLPRGDGIVLGHVSQRGEWSLDVDEEARQRVVENAMAVFGAMRSPLPGVPLTASTALPSPPPFESFLGLSS